MWEKVVRGVSISSPLRETVLYPEIRPSPEQLTELRHEIGDVYDWRNPLYQLHHRVFALKNNRCVKFGRGVYEKEAMAMEYVRRNTTIPVPRVYAFFRSEDGKDGYIVMDYVKSAAILGDVQCRISPSERKGYVVQINDYIHQLRQLGAKGAESMGSWQPDNLGEATAYNNVFYSGLGELQPAGPFHSMEELKQHWVLRWRKRGDLGSPPDIQVDQVPHHTVLTHGDLATRNVLVKDGLIVAVLDWDSFGWYPSFWEYAFCRRGSLYVEWKETFDEVFGPMTTPERNFAIFIREAFSRDD